jgi:hypothetical protein
MVVVEEIGDEWSSVGVTTTLRVLFENNRPKCCQPGSGGMLSASLCGFGWRFLVDTQDQGPGDTIRVLFDPHLIKNSALGPLNISVKRKSTEMKRAEYFDKQWLDGVSLTGDSDTPSVLSTYQSSETLTYPILSITVSFPITLPLQIPKPSGLLRMNEAIKQSLTGSEFFDTKF